MGFARDTMLTVNDAVVLAKLFAITELLALVVRLTGSL